MAYTTPRTWLAGEFVDEGDLNEQLRDNFNAVAPLGAAAFPTWSPTVTQSNTPTKTTNHAAYYRLGRLVVVFWNITFTSAGTATNNIVLSNLPVTASDLRSIQGSFRYFDAGNTNRAGHVRGTGTTSCVFNYDGFGNEMGNGDFAIANTDVFEGMLMYQAAS